MSINYEENVSERGENFRNGGGGAKIRIVYKYQKVIPKNCTLLPEPKRPIQCKGAPNLAQTPPDPPLLTPNGPSPILSKMSRFKRMPRPNDHKIPKKLDVEDVSYIMDRYLRKEHRENQYVMRFLSNYLMCRDPSQAADEAKISRKDGRLILNRKDVQEMLVQVTKTAVLKDGLDPSEIVEKVKNIAFVDPADVVNPDGTAIENLHDVPAEARRAIKKFEVKNLYETDSNGIKVVVGRLVKVEFWDRLKASEMLGREVGKFKETHRVEHDVTGNMKDMLLEARNRAESKARAERQKRLEKEAKTIEVKAIEGSVDKS